MAKTFRLSYPTESDEIRKNQPHTAGKEKRKENKKPESRPALSCGVPGKKG
jgi:hypothetical protein